MAIKEENERITSTIDQSQRELIDVIKEKNNYKTDSRAIKYITNCYDLAMDIFLTTLLGNEKLTERIKKSIDETIENLSNLLK